MKEIRIKYITCQLYCITNNLAHSRWEPLPHLTLAQFLTQQLFLTGLLNTITSNSSAMSHECSVIKHVLLGPRQQPHCLHIAHTLPHFSFLISGCRKRILNCFEARLAEDRRGNVSSYGHMSTNIKKSFPVIHNVSSDKHAYSHSVHSTPTLHMTKKSISLLWPSFFSTGIHLVHTLGWSLTVFPFNGNYVTLRK